MGRSTSDDVGLRTTQHAEYTRLTRAWPPSYQTTRFAAAQRPPEPTKGAHTRITLAHSISRNRLYTHTYTILVNTRHSDNIVYMAQISGDEQRDRHRQTQTKSAIIQFDFGQTFVVRVEADISQVFTRRHSHGSLMSDTTHTQDARRAARARTKRFSILNGHQQAARCVFVSNPISGMFVFLWCARTHREQSRNLNCVHTLAQRDLCAIYLIVETSNLGRVRRRAQR